MDSTIISALIGVIGALIGAWAGGAISRKASVEAAKSSNENAINIMKRQEFFSAASKFKATILYELLGFYPVEQYWDKKNFERFYTSIPIILSVAAEFRSHINRKDDFDVAVKNYEEYCRKTNPEAIRSDNFYPKEGEIGKREEFKNIIEHLLSFADEN